MTKNLTLLKIENIIDNNVDSMVYKFFDKKSSGGGIKNENISNKKIAAELHKPIIINFSQKKNSKFLFHLLTIML